MTFSGDPFRTLGLPAGSSEAEVKRAYRALAKRYHPDSAGEAALPRFLAIQAAYDMLTTPGGRARVRPAPGSRASATPGTGSGTHTRGSGPARPSGSDRPPAGGGRAAGERASAADPAAAWATRDAFRSRRTQPGAPRGPMGGPAWWAAGRNGMAGG